MESTSPTSLAVAAAPQPNAGSAKRRRSRLGTVIALAAILLLAAILRLHGLAHQSLWYDEALTVIHIRKPLLQMLASARLLENMPPLYFSLMWVWARVCGTSDFAMRLPSALLGIASVGMMFRIARRMATPRDRDRVGLLAALLLAISRHQIFHCQEARAYSLMMFLCLLSCDCFLRLIGFGAEPHEAPPGPATATLYVLVSAAMLWTQPFSGFSLAAQNVFFGLLWAQSFWRTPPLPQVSPTTMSMRRWLTMQAEILLLFGPWLAHLRQVVTIGSPWMHEPHVMDAVREYGDSAILAAVLGVLVALALVRGLWRREAWVVLAILLGTLPVCVPLLASSAKHPLFIPRYGMPALIGLYLLAAGGASLLGSIGGWTAAAIVCAAAMPHLASDFRHERNWFPRPDVRDVAAVVDQRAGHGDGLVFAESLDWRIFSVYCPRTDLVTLPQVPRKPADGPMPRHIWFVGSTGQLDPHGGWIAGTPYRLIEEWKFDRIVLAEIQRR